MNLQSLLKHWIGQRGNQTALVDLRLGEVCWQQLGQMVVAACRALADFDRSLPIAHRCKNHIEDIVTAIAIAEIGGIEAPIDHRVNDAEFDRRLQILGGQRLMDETKRAFLDSIRSARSIESAAQTFANQTFADEGSSNPSIVPGVILWTSGTTSIPRGVHLSYASWLSNANAKLKAVPQAVDDVRLTVLPISHAYARTCDLGTWLLSGSTLAITLGYEGTRKAIADVRPTLINCVPSIANRMLDHCDQMDGLDRLRLLGVGGAALPESSFEAWKRKGVTVIQGYGLTETGPVICSATPENARADLVGDFVDGWQTRIDEGQLWVRGDHAMLGYWNDDAATSQKVDPDGWIQTGDLVSWDDSESQLRILGRADDVIVLDNGMKLHPSTIERRVEQVSGVRHAMLVLRERLELWLDAEVYDETLVLTKLQLPRLDVQVKQFDPPLSREAGELTIKNTIRRHKIARRFD